MFLVKLIETQEYTVWRYYNVLYIMKIFYKFFTSALLIHLQMLPSVNEGLEYFRIIVFQFNPDL